MHFPDCGAENLWILKEKGKANSNMTLVLVSAGNTTYFHVFILNVKFKVVNFPTTVSLWSPAEIKVRRDLFKSAKRRFQVAHLFCLHACPRQICLKVVVKQNNSFKTGTSKLYLTYEYSQDFTDV